MTIILSNFYLQFDRPVWTRAIKINQSYQDEPELSGIFGSKISNLWVPLHYLILNIFAHTHHMLSNLKKSGNVVSLRKKHILMANSKVQLRFFLPHNIQVVLNLTRPNEHCRQFIVSLDLHVLILMTYARHRVHC